MEGTIRECCQIEANRVVVKKDGAWLTEKCCMCDRRHITLEVDSGVIGVDGESI